MQAVVAILFSLSPGKIPNFFNVLVKWALAGGVWLPDPSRHSGQNKTGAA
jgi:hypothetical protein